MPLQMHRVPSLERLLRSVDGVVVAEPLKELEKGSYWPCPWGVVALENSAAEAAAQRWLCALSVF